MKTTDGERIHRVIPLTPGELKWIAREQPCMDCGHLGIVHWSAGNMYGCNVEGCNCEEIRGAKEQRQADRLSRRLVEAVIAETPRPRRRQSWFRRLWKWVVWRR